MDAVPDYGEPLLDSHQLYRTRWWILLVLSLLSFSQCLFWLSFSPISKNAEAYFGVGEAHIAWWLNMGPVAGILGQPFSTSLAAGRQDGLRRTVRVAAVSMAVAMVIRLVPALVGCEKEGWGIAVVYIAQFINGAIGPMTMGVPAMMSAQWFGDSERTLATAIAVLANNLGACGGFFLAPALVSLPEHTPRLMWFHAGFGLFMLGLTFLHFPAAPPTPPSPSASALLASETEPLSLSLVMDVVRKREMLLLALGPGVMAGIFNVWTGSFDQILPTDWGFTQTVNGNLGVVSTLCVVVGGISVGGPVGLPPWNTRLKELLIFFFSLCSVIFGIACFALPTPWNTAGTISILGFWPICVLITVFSLCFGMALPLVYELAAENTYPASAAISTNIIVFVLNLGAFIFLFALAPLLKYDVLNFLLFGVTLSGTLACFMLKPKYLRLAEKVKQEPGRTYSVEEGSLQ